MKSTTGAEPTAFSMADFVSTDRKRAATSVYREFGVRKMEDGLATPRKAYQRSFISVFGGRECKTGDTNRRKDYSIKHLK